MYRLLVLFESVRSIKTSLLSRRAAPFPPVTAHIAGAFLQVIVPTSRPSPDLRIIGMVLRVTGQNPASAGKHPAPVMAA